MTPFISEIVGTFLLMVLGLGVNANVSLQKPTVMAPVGS